MPKFTIEMTYDVPHYRQTTYDAPTLADAFAMANEDENWDRQKSDFETCGPNRITGAWEGEEAYVGADLSPGDRHPMAAADAMLAALKALREWNANMGHWDAPCWAQAADAINKAEATGAVAWPQPQPQPLKAIVEVSGGVAEVTQCPGGVEVEIIDHDNEEAEAEAEDVWQCAQCGTRHFKGDGHLETWQQRQCMACGSWNDKPEDARA